MQTGTIIAGGVAALLLVGLGVGGFGTGELPGGGTKPGGGTTPKPGGGSKPKPGGGTPKPGGTLPKPTAGRVFGTGTGPLGWDATGNGFWISPDCDLVLEGEQFEPASRGVKTIWAESEPTLAETLAKPGNSVYGFVDYLKDYRGFQTAEEIAIEIMREANPLCADVFPDQAPAALQDWFDSFVERISEWVYVTTIGEFDPEGPDA